MAPRTLLCCLASLALLLTLAGCRGEQEGAPGGPAPVAQPAVGVDPDGKGPEQAKQARILCEQETGDRGSPCAAAAELRPVDFEPTPADVACTELFGGPETATITGTLAREK